MCPGLRVECCPPRAAIHQDRVGTLRAHITAEGMAATADRVDIALAATARHADTAEAVTAHRRVATAHLAGIADRPMAVRRGDIVAEATPRRRRMAQARSAAAADTPGHRGASAAMPARAAPMAGAALIAAGVGRTVEAAATVVIANL